MRRLVAYLFPVLMLAVFLAVTVSGSILKKPTGPADDVAGHIQRVRDDVINARWSDAANDRKRLEGAWNRVLTRIQFGGERDQINRLDTALARLKGAILARDKAGALMELSEAEEHWRDIGR